VRVVCFFVVATMAAATFFAADFQVVLSPSLPAAVSDILQSGPRRQEVTIRESFSLVIYSILGCPTYVVLRVVHVRSQCPKAPKYFVWPYYTYDAKCPISYNHFLHHLLPPTRTKYSTYPT